MRSRRVLIVALGAACGGDASERGDETSGTAANTSVGSTSTGAGSSDASTGGTTDDGATTNADESTGGSTPPQWLPQLVDVRFECKLINGLEVELPSENHTHTRFNLRGTDLGIPLAIEDQLHLFFGDTHGYRVIWTVGEDPDSVAFASAAAVTRDPTVLCRELEFYVTPDVPSVAAGVDPTIERDFAATTMTPPRGEALADYIGHHPDPFPNIPGSFEVPTGALASGGAVYLFWAGKSELTPVARMTLSYLARWDAPRVRPDYQIVRPIDSLDSKPLGGHFMQIAPFIVGEHVYMLGTGEFRRSGIHLGRIPLAALETGAGQEIFDPVAGAWLDPAALDVAAREAVEPLLENDGVGELGGIFVAGVDVFLLMYQRELHGRDGGIVDNRIVLRTASALEGPWSEAVTVIDMADPAFAATHCCGVDCPDPQVLHCESAGLYASYLLPYVAVTPGDDGSMGLGVTFLASTWNPYNVVMFAADLVLEPAGG